MASLRTFWGEDLTYDVVRIELGTEAVTAGTMRDRLRQHGYQAFLIEGTEQDLQDQLRRGRAPLIGIVRPSPTGKGLTHYLLVVAYHPQREQYAVIDPAYGLRALDASALTAMWAPASNLTLVAFPAAP